MRRLFADPGYETAACPRSPSSWFRAGAMAGVRSRREEAVCATED